MNSSFTSVDWASAVSQLNQKYSTQRTSLHTETTIDAKYIIKALDEFMECVRYLNTRRSTSAILTLDSESAVQDAIYLMLRPWVLDLIPENPSDRIAAARYTIKDFLIPSAKTVIEAKYIRDANHAKSITKELHDDIETYRHHPACKNLIFFLYDPNALIPDQAALKRQIVIDRQYDGVALTCHLIVKP